MVDFSFMDEASTEEIADKEDLTRAQLALIRDTFTSTDRPPMWLAGGYAEEALLNGQVTSEHGDVDFVAMFTDAKRIKGIYEGMGYQVTETHDPQAPQPYKLLLKKGNLGKVDIGLFYKDKQTGRIYADTGDGKGARYRVYFEPGVLSDEEQKLGDLSVKTMSPQFLMQAREVFWQIGREASPRPRDLTMQEALRTRFFPDDDLKSHKFKPEIVPMG